MAQVTLYGQKEWEVVAMTGGILSPLMTPEMYIHAEFSVLLLILTRGPEPITSLLHQGSLIFLFPNWTAPAALYGLIELEQQTMIMDFPSVLTTPVMSILPDGFREPLTLTRELE